MPRDPNYYLGGYDERYGPNYLGSIGAPAGSTNHTNFQGADKNDVLSTGDNTQQSNTKTRLMVMTIVRSRYLW